MWKSLFRRGPKPAEPGPRSSHPSAVPNDVRVYAFGDVHGRLDLLDRLAVMIAQDLDTSPVRHPILVGLGDYIDRGPNSAGVIDTLCKGPVRGVDQVFMRGNHEQLLLDFLDDPSRYGPTWLQVGALATLKSYGVSARADVGSRSDFKPIRDALAANIPAAHLDLIREMPVWHAVGDYLFVHAGVRRGVPIERQSFDDLLWLRYEPADQDEPFEQVVVHGHTPVTEPFIGRYRINVDTGAYASNRLTCVILQETSKRVLQT